MNLSFEVSEKTVRTVAIIGAVLFIAFIVAVIISGDMGYMLAW